VLFTSSTIRPRTVWVPWAVASMSIADDSNNAKQNGNKVILIICRGFYFKTKMEDKTPMTIDHG
jgi:hypothetical protein